MTIKLLGAASAFALSMAFAGGAMAQQANNNTDSGITQSADQTNGNTDSSTHTTRSGNTRLSDSQNSDSSTTTRDSGNTDNSAHLRNSGNTDNSTTTRDSGNTDNSAHLRNSGNTDNSTTNRDSGNTDSSTHLRDSQNTTDSNNTRTSTNNSTHSFTLTSTMNVGTQDLAANVSGITAGSDSWTGGADNRAVTTGAITQQGSAFQGMAGIQTASTNTGFASASQVGTLVQANANVTFGAP